MSHYFDIVPLGLSHLRHTVCIQTIFRLILTIPGGKPKTQVIGAWLRTLGLQMPQWNMFERRKNLTGVTIVNTILPWPPITIVEEDNEGYIYHTGESHMLMYSMLENC